MLGRNGDLAVKQFQFARGSLKLVDEQNPCPQHITHRYADWPARQRFLDLSGRYLDDQTQRIEDRQ